MSQPNNMGDMVLCNRLLTHSEIKPKLLKLIAKISQPKKEKNDIISNTDFSLAKDHKKEYLDLFYKHIPSVMQDLCKNFHCKRWEIHNAWFQQYCKNDYHGWHNHGNCQFANVYYLELPDRKMTTEFYENDLIKAEEGSILTFPSVLIHRSKLHLSNKRKTIIAFNSSFYAT